MCTLVSRLDDKINESDLTLLNIGSAPVHEHRDRDPKLFLFVALVKKLDKQKLNPLPANIELLGWITYISQVEHLAADILLWVFWSWIEVFLTQSVFKLRCFLEVLSHVGRQNGTNHQFSDSLEIVFREIREDVEIRLV